jgi:hypothetical protein
MIASTSHPGTSPFGSFRWRLRRAVTCFTMTVIHSDTVMVLFANGRLYGAAPYDAEQLENRKLPPVLSGTPSVAYARTSEQHGLVPVSEDSMPLLRGAVSGNLPGGYLRSTVRAVRADGYGRAQAGSCRTGRQGRRPYCRRDMAVTSGRPIGSTPYFWTGC